MAKAEQIILQGNISDYDSFMDENRRMINEQFNKVLLWCILAGPFIALAVKFQIFQGVTYLTAIFSSAFMATLALIHRYLMRQHGSSILTPMIALIAIDVLLFIMDSAHLTIFISWFLIPLLAVQLCDFKLYMISVVINYGFMVAATWHMAPYFAERRTDVNTPVAYFASRLGGLTVEMIVMIFAGYSLCKIMSNHYKTLIEQYKTLLEEKERSHMLQDASERAIAASEAKSAFLSNMSHEIRTPINAMLGMNEMILRETDDTNVLAYSDSIKVAGNTLLGLINDILDFSKIEAGKIEILPVDYDLSSVINDLVNMIQARADEKGLSLSLDFDKDMPKLLHGDEVRIKQVITNILTNAVKYTEKGTVTFSIHYDRIPDEPDSIFLVVSVKDTGIGIKEEDMQRIFGEFERLEEERNRNIEGTGLGMSITKRLLEMMGSTLQVDSVYGEGSKFYFILEQKVVKWEELGDYETAYKTLMQGQKRYRESFISPDAQILIVDDNPMNLMVIKSLLKRTQVHIDMAESGKEALSLALEKKYDMIFLDHMMPEMDGIETLHHMKEDPEHPNRKTPMICLTANAISGARERYISAGFDDYLTKPIDTDQLEHTMLKYLPKDRIQRTDAVEAQEQKTIPKELEVLLDQDWIDLETGMKNSGSIEAYMPLLKIFYTSMEDKADELERLYHNADYNNYTIRVHALKSSARIIGATAFGEEAQLLENAGKAGDVTYIKEHHDTFMQTYLSFQSPLSELFRQEGTEQEKPEADSELMADVFEELALGAEEMDCDRLQAVITEMEEYSIPASEKERWDAISEAVSRYDYEAVLEQVKRG